MSSESVNINHLLTPDKIADLQEEGDAILRSLTTFKVLEDMSVEGRQHRADLFRRLSRVMAQLGRDEDAKRYSEAAQRVEAGRERQVSFPRGDIACG